VRKSIFISLFFIIFFISVPAQTNDTVLVLPFENASGKPEFNWVGESFADSVSDLLKVPTVDVVTNDARKVIQMRLGVPPTTLPSLATSLKIAREGRATLLVTGRYNIVPAQGEIAAGINVTTKIIRVNEGRFVSEELPDGTRTPGRQINLIDALANLQTVQGQLAYQILLQRNRNLEFSQKHFVELANKVPAKAFEAYIKGLLTPDTDVKTREGFYKNAMRFYAEAKASEPDENAKIYTDVALELGHSYLSQKQFGAAIEYFSKVPGNDSRYAEAAFYIGIIYWQQNNFEQALAILSPLADELKLNSVYNTLGAIAVQASRAEKDKTKAAARLNQGLEFLKKASESDPEDPESRFNYSVALFLNNNFEATIQQIRPILASNQNDGEAYYLLTKSFEMTGKTAEAAQYDEQARRFANNYAKLETEWQRTKAVDGLNLRGVQPPRRDFVNLILIKKQNTPAPQNLTDETAVWLAQAEAFFNAGKEEDALRTIRKILSGEPMNARANLLLGKVYLRQTNWDDALHSLKTALFWDNQLIEAHVLLAKIFLERKDCQQAQSYVASALAIDENNQEALGLQRQVERCSK
jgi:tetratricopeptide (TPR) repeat protein